MDIGLKKQALQFIQNNPGCDDIFLAGYVGFDVEKELVKELLLERLIRDTNCGRGLEKHFEITSEGEKFAKKALDIYNKLMDKADADEMKEYHGKMTELSEKLIV